MTRRRASAILAALGLAAGAVLAVQAFARSSASYDFGDAPDGVNAGYAEKPDVMGRFPAKAASAGPRHAGSGPWIGKTWSAEPGSRQVDRDLDDGAQVKPRSCAMSTLTLAIDATRGDAGAPIRVNAWFDWNQDGDWGDGGTRSCGPEWSIQNIEIDPASLGEGRVGVVTLRFRAGKVPRQFWWRVQIQQGSTLVPHRAGGDQAVPTSGETEDWLYGRAPKAVPSLVCSPAYAILTHGGVHEIDFRLLGRTPDLGILRSRIGFTGNRDGVVVRRPAIPDGWRIRLVTTRHDRTPIMQSFRVFMHVGARVDGRWRLAAFRTGCNVTVVHGSGPIFPPFQPPKKLGPALTGRIVINPGTPTPEAARCGASISDALGYFRVRTVCKGVDIKSTTVWYSTEKVRWWAADPREWSSALLKYCGSYTTPNELKCRWKAPNAGRTLEHRVFPPAGGRTRIALHVLAGGTGENGTAVVLRQQWYALGGGEFSCSQSVPAAKSCTAAG